MMKKRNTHSRLNKVDYSIFIICSLCAAFMFYLFWHELNSSSLKQNEQSIATIYFKKNVAQRRFINKSIWEKISTETLIYNGDKIRTAEESEAYVMFDEDTKIELGSNTMIQLFKDKKNNGTIDFMNGNIHVENTEKAKKTVIKTGTKKIQISAQTQLNVEIDKDFSNNAVIEVLQGQASVIQTDSKGKEIEKLKTISAGQVEVLRVNEIISKEELAEKEKEKESDEEVTPEDLEKVEPVIVEVNESGLKKVKTAELAEFSNDQGWHCHQYVNVISELIGDNKTIPKGSLLTINIKGVSDSTIPAMKVHLGAYDSDGVYYDNSSIYSVKSITKDIPFDITIDSWLLHRIYNTSYSYITLFLDDNDYNDSINIKDLKVSLKVSNLDYKRDYEPASNYPVKPVASKKIQFHQNVWGDKGWETTGRDMEFFMTEFFKEKTLIKKGRKLKVTLTATSNIDLPYLGIQSISSETWNLAIPDEQYDITPQYDWSEGPIIKAGKKFTFSRIINFSEDMYIDTYSGHIIKLTYGEPVRECAVFDIENFTFEFVD